MKHGETIKLLSYIESTILLDKDIDFTIDLNGYELSGRGGTNEVFKITKGTLTITDSSKLGTGIITTEHPFTIWLEGGNLVLESCTLQNESSVHYEEHEGFAAIYNFGDGSVTISDATIISRFANGIKSRNTIIKGTCIVTSYNKAMLYLPEYSGYSGSVLITASMDEAGTPTVLYNEASFSNYRYLKFEPAPPCVVTWKSQDGESILEIDNVTYNGSKPSYDGETPTKARDDEYTYIFAGWSTVPNAEVGVPAENLPVIRGDITYYAAFSKTKREPVASIIHSDGSTISYAELQRAVDNVRAGETLKLLTDIERTEDLIIAEYSDFTLDLNGKILSFTDSSDLDIGRGSNIIIQDRVGEGIITSNIVKKGEIYRGTIYMNDDCTLRINSGILENTSSGYAIYANASDVIIEGGAVTSSYSAIKLKDSTLTISGGTVYSSIFNTITGNPESIKIQSGSPIILQSYVKGVMELIPDLSGFKGRIMANTTSSASGAIEITESHIDTISEIQQYKYIKFEPQYEVTWKSQNGEEVLKTDTVYYGTNPSYDGAAPTKEGDAEYVYTFAGWSTVANAESGNPIESLPTVTGDVTYYAAFSKRANILVAEIIHTDGSTKNYVDLQDAMNNVKAGETLKLLMDIERTADLTTASRSNFTLDLNGKELKFNNYKNFIIDDFSNLVIHDSVGNGKLAIIKGEVQVVNNSTLRIVRITVENGENNWYNPSKVTTDATSVKLTVGKSKTVKSQVVLPKGKKLIEHTKVIRYESSDKEIATVNSKGKITAKGKGSCYVYVYAQNGVYKRIKVTVQ